MKGSGLRKESIVKPKPYKDFRKKRVLYIPLDSFSRAVQKALLGKAAKEKSTGWGTLYLLPDQVVLYQAVGAPASVLILERLIASGVKEILLLGICGSLSPNRRIGTAASISRAYSNEGTSVHYFPQKKIFHPSPALKEKTEVLLKTSGLAFSESPVVSMDAPFRETKLWLEEMRSQRIELVDMEASAVFALAEFYGIQAAALMIVSDELFSGRWKQRFLSLALEKKIKDYFQIFI
ncbi:MAG: nucleoside phosphorylase [Candidatus Aminicenantales bacterium]